MSVSPILSGETEPYYDLGSYHRPIDTPSPQAQIWFDRGLVWAYAFNHEESIRCFERALELDPDLADRAVGYRLLHRAQLQQGVGGVRPGRPGGVAGPRPNGTRPGRQGPGVRGGTRLDRRPAGPLPHRRPERHRCAARRPRRLRRCDGQAGARRIPTTSTCRRWPPTHCSTSPRGRCGTPAPANRRRVRGWSRPSGSWTMRWPRRPAAEHPGVLHLYLHAMEMSATPQDALPAADLLRGTGARRRPPAAHAQPYRRAVR